MEPRHSADAYLDHNLSPVMCVRGGVVISDCPYGGHHSQFDAIFTSLKRPRRPFVEILACVPMSAGDEV